MLKCQEKVILGFALLIVLIKEKFKQIKDIFMKYYIWLFSVLSDDDNLDDCH